MKTSIALLFTALCSTQAWIFPDNKAFKKFVAAAGVSAALVTAPMIASADGKVDFSGSYTDPSHPNCKRVVAVAGDKATISGTDGNPGCPANGSGKGWEVTGKVKGDTVVFDFSRKGGPKNLKGAWDKNGILFEDGNKWSLKNI